MPTKFYFMYEQEDNDDGCLPMFLGVVIFLLAVIITIVVTVLFF